MGRGGSGVLRRRRHGVACAPAALDHLPHLGLAASGRPAAEVAAGDAPSKAGEADGQVDDETQHHHPRSHGGHAATAAAVSVARLAADSVVGFAD